MVFQCCFRCLIAVYPFSVILFFFSIILSCLQEAQGIECPPPPPPPGPPPPGAPPMASAASRVAAPSAPPPPGPPPPPSSSGGGGPPAGGGLASQLAGVGLRSVANEPPRVDLTKVDRGTKANLQAVLATAMAQRYEEINLLSFCL
jgi:hypothetical protein